MPQRLRIRRSGVRISPGAPEKTGSYDSGRNSPFLCPAHLQARCKQKHLGGYQPSRVPMGRAFPPSLLHLTSRGRCPANQAKNLCFVPATTFFVETWECGGPGSVLDAWLAGRASAVRDGRFYGRLAVTDCHHGTICGSPSWSHPLTWRMAICGVRSNASTATVLRRANG